MEISESSEQVTDVVRRETYRSRQKLASWLGSVGTAALRLLPAETAHEIGMAVLQRRLLDWLPAPAVAPLAAGMSVVVPGIGALPHPFGLAAGFDKHARAPEAFARLGFAFLEIGTVTPQPQPGNPKPRVFRFPEQRALINRMGFNSDGAAAVAERLREKAWDHERVPLGVNCGKNKDTPLDRAIFDYLTVMEATDDLARYFVVNISSPNTPGLRELASPQFLNGLADELGDRRLPRTWVKLDPDLGRKDFQALIAVLAERGYQGVILTNTHRVNWPEPGGQSGHPLTALANTRLEWAHEVTQGRLPMIASGGVLSGIDAFEKLARGASAVQIYTALVYRGPWVVAQLLVELAAELALRGFAHVEDAIGSHYED
jgi:dihydroorotate dehydrogenase